MADISGGQATLLGGIGAWQGRVPWSWSPRSDDFWADLKLGELETLEHSWWQMSHGLERLGQGTDGQWRRKMPQSWSGLPK